MRLFFVIICSLFTLVVYSQGKKIGDIIENPDGSRGVIFWLSPEGNSGWMVALYDLPQRKPWGSIDVNVPDLPDMGAVGLPSLQKSMSDTSGYKNTAILRKLQGKGTSYAAQCVDFENGWYLPACGQLRKLYSVVNQINPVLVSSGGSALKTSGALLEDYAYSSSTEGDKTNNWCTVFANGQVGVILKNIVVRVRPIRTFSIQKVDYDTTLSYQWTTGATTPEISDVPARTTVYQVSATTAAGCRNTAQREVFVASADPVIIEDSICFGEVYRKNGFEESETGEYQHILTNAAGCDQKIILKLKVLDPVELIIRDTICAGEIYHKNNFSVWEPGEYKQLWRGTNGCDSTVILNLAVRPTYVNTLYETICEGEIYTKHNFNVSEPGRYEQYLTTVNGCDSLLVLNLAVNSAYHTSIYDTICEGEVYDQYGFSETTSGDYDLPLRTVSGCDSLVTLHLTVNPVYYTEISDTICEGEVYNQYGFSAFLTGDYNRSLQTVNGCDSLVTLHLTVHPSRDTELFDTICKGEVYHRYGFSETLEGDYTQFLKTIHGCDSLVVLHLAVNPVWHVELFDTICGGEVYNKYGFSETLPGDYNLFLQTGRGCDSLVTLHLADNPSYHLEITDTICEGEVYHQYGFSEAATGRYERRLQTVKGCDSLFVLNLTVNPSWHIELFDTICAGEVYERYGFKETIADDYQRLLQTSRECDSLVTLHLTVNPVFDFLFRDTVCVGSAYNKYGFTIPQAMIGQECEPLQLKSSRGCDSLVRLELKVNPVSFTTETSAICAGEGYLFQDQLLYETGIYQDTLHNQWGCDSIIELYLDVNPVYRDTIKASVCAGERYQLHGFDESETGLYKQTWQTKDGCDSIIYLELQVNDYFEGSLQIGVEDCILHKYYLEADWEDQVLIKGTRYLWDFGEGEKIQAENEVYHVYADTGTYQICLQVITPGNCAKEWKQTLSVPYYSPDLAIYADPEYVDSDHPRIRLSTDSIAGMHYRWEFGDGEQAKGCFVEHTYVFREQGTFQVTLERVNKEDCRVQQTFLVYAYVSVNPPNTFSPNEDGINDYFMKGYRVRIVDRNGVEIFKGNDGWDGKRNGQQVPEDTYFYELFYLTPQGEKLKTGYITVVR